jgi:hypothetical protein
MLGEQKRIIGKNFGLLPTLVVYPKIYQISFAKVQTTKINRYLTKPFCVF